MSLACLEVLKESCTDLKPQAVGGLSLGEFTALTVAGGLSFEDALKIVQARGQFMQEACEQKPGTMASILGLDYLKVHQICESFKAECVVAVANVNCPGQIVISGESEGVRRVIEEAKRQGARRVIELQVSGAFHSPLMEPARVKLKEFLSQFEIHPPKIIFISNVLGRAVESPDQIRNLLVDQVTHSVLWEQGVRDLIRQGFRSFVEVGCGKVLSGLQRKIDSESKIFHVEDIESLEEAKSLLSVKSEA
jgi:[acyl-carrier-protein] S-malonyltransferase